MIRIVVLLVAVALCCPRAVVSQVLEGRLTDNLTQRPVANVRVVLLNLDSAEVTATLSDMAGAFELIPPTGGQFRLFIGAPGYQPFTSAPFTLAVGEQHRIAVVMTSLPRELEPIESTAPAPTRRPLEGFWERRADGVGSFLTRAEFEKLGSPKEPTDVLRRMSGIRLYPASGQVGGMRYHVRTNRGRSRTISGGALGCAPLYFIDGRYVGTAETQDIDAMLSLEHVEAVEVYGSAASVPTQFNRTGATCGVIVFWTR